MKKIMKRLLTAILAFATVITTLPATQQVHAADSVYTTTEGKAGTIVKVDNGGIEIKSFEESITIADGQTAYCIDINTDFKSGYKNRINAEDRMSDEQITDVALSLEYVKEYAKKHTSLSNTQVYLLEQCVVQRRLSVHLGWGYNNVRAAYDEVSEKIQSEVYANAKEFVNKNKDRYECDGYIYTGEGQDLGQFWAKLDVGNATIQKTSANTSITKDNDCYSLAGATYGIYSNKDCIDLVTSLTTDKNGNTDIVEIQAGTYYVKETEARKGSICLPLGTITVEEQTAPTDYLLEGAYMQTKHSSEQITGLYVAQITEDGELAVLSGSNQYSVSDKVIRGGVKIQKRDLETKGTKAQGCATLKDTAFTITTLNDNPVLVNGKLYNKNEVVMTIYKGVDGIATTDADTLPYGKYRIKESKAPQGYLTTSATSREFEITANGKIVDLTDEENSVYNQIKRGDIEGIKIGAGTHERLANVPFKITSKTTGESHIIVIDNNGLF